MSVGATTWSGTGACAGTVVGPARPVRHDRELAGPSAGDGVLVVRHATPGVLPSLVDVAALVCEEGALLGHAAVLARELGIPCVVGCAGLVEAVRQGRRCLRSPAPDDQGQRYSARSAHPITPTGVNR